MIEIGDLINIYMIHLYVKTHRITGLKYFGKTTCSDPITYQGSGKYWKRHLKTHGTNFSTEIIGSFENEEEATKIALEFSEKHNIVESSDWANLIPENGLDGKPKGSIGHKFSKEEREKISICGKKRWANQNHREEMSNIHKQRFIENPKLREEIGKRTKSQWTDERKEKHRNSLIGHLGSTKLKGVPKPNGFGDKISNSLKGKTKSDTHKENLSKAAKNRIKTKCVCGKEYLPSHKRYHSQCSDFSK